jgi:hypothetical protein
VAAGAAAVVAAVAVVAAAVVAAGDAERTSGGRSMHSIRWLAFGLGCSLVIAGAGCTLNRGAATAPTGITQLSFATPEDAVAALTYLAASGDREYGRSLFGPEVDELSSGDEEVDDYERELFAAAIERRHDLRTNDDGTVDVLIGDAGAAFPVPLIEHDGRWLFDTLSGVDRMTDIRVGYHELKTLQALRVVPEAQQEYRSVDRNGDGILAYARHFASSEGTRDGLYWPTAPDEPDSPLGEFFAESEVPRSKTLGYNGYFFKMLTAQGPHAPGGARSYLDAAGHLVGGFAVLAYPAVYGETAIMTFQMGADGVVHQRDLGPDATTKAGVTIDTYDPGPGWTITTD